MSYFSDGIFAFKQGDYSKAINEFHAAIEENDQNHKAWNAMGVTCSKLGMHEEAETCFDNALLIYPNSERYLKNKETLIKKKIKPSKQHTYKRIQPSSKRYAFRIKSIFSVILVIGIVLILLTVGLNFLSNSATKASSPQVSPTVPSDSSSSSPSSVSNNGGILGQVKDVQVSGPDGSSISLIDSASTMLSSDDTKTITGAIIAEKTNENQKTVSGLPVVRDENQISYTYQGGADSDKVQNVIVHWADKTTESLGNTSGKTVTHYAIEGQNHVLAVAEYKDGSKSVILDTSV